MARWTDSDTPISELPIEDTECYASTLSHTRFLPLRLERGQMEEHNGIPPPSMERGSHAADLGSGTTTFPPKVRSWCPRFIPRICKNLSTEDISSSHETCRACNKGLLQTTSALVDCIQNKMLLANFLSDQYLWRFSLPNMNILGKGQHGSYI